MAAAALAAVAAAQMVAGREDNVRAFAVEVFALDECGRLSAQVALRNLTRHRGLKTERRACAAVDAGRAEAVLVELTVEEVFELAEEAQRARLAERKRVARGHIRTALPAEVVCARRERAVVEDWREIVTRRYEVEVDCYALAESLCRDERQLVIRNRKRTEHARNGRDTLVAVRERVRREQVERACGRGFGAQLRAAREAA